MKIPTYSVKEIIYLVEQTETMSYLDKVYDVLEKELELYSSFEANTLKLMMACKSMAIIIQTRIKF